MSTWVWVLTFTVLGTNAEHRSFSKYATKQECEQVLQSMKQEKLKQNQHIAGTCNLVLK